MLNHALDLARRGFRVLPLIPGTKRPAIERWQDLATTDEAILRKVWAMNPNCNIGIAMGQGLVGLDIDVKDGKAGEASFETLGLSVEDVDTFTVLTPSGGRHVYFTGPDVPNSAGGLGDGLDIRGAGGFLVGPGSRLTNGSGSGVYVIVRDEPLRPAPLSLLSHISLTRRAPSPGQPLVDLDEASAVARARDYLNGHTGAVEGQGGDHVTLTVAMRLKDFGVSEDVTFELMLDHWTEKCDPPWEPEALKTKVQNAYRYGENQPGSDHPAVLFAGVDVEPPKPAPRPVGQWFRHSDVKDYDLAKSTWLFYEALPAVGTAVIVGPSQTGKTFLIGEAARCLATGKPFFGIEPDEKGGTIVLFSGTEGSGWPLRLAALQETDDLPISATTVQNLAGKGALDRLLETVKEEAERMQLLYGVPLRMVVLETLSASGLLMDENSNAEAAQAWTNLGTIARILGVLFITTHHPPKEGRGNRGAGALTGSPDGVLEVYREGKDTARRVDVVKARNAPQRMLGTYTLVPVQLGVDNKGRPVTSAVVSMGEAIKTVLGRAPTRMKEFQQAIDFAFVDSAETIDGEQMIDKQAALDQFKDHFPEMDRSQRHKLWQKCLDYAMDMGTIETRVVHRVHYLNRKEVTA